jgi:hypothetical protein
MFVEICVSKYLLCVSNISMAVKPFFLDNPGQNYLWLKEESFFGVKSSAEVRRKAKFFQQENFATHRSAETDTLEMLRLFSEYQYLTKSLRLFLLFFASQCYEVLLFKSRGLAIVSKLMVVLLFSCKMDSSPSSSRFDGWLCGMDIIVCLIANKLRKCCIVIINTINRSMSQAVSR